MVSLGMTGVREPEHRQLVKGCFFSLFLQGHKTKDACRWGLESVVRLEAVAIQRPLVLFEIDGKTTCWLQKGDYRKVVSFAGNAKGPAESSNQIYSGTNLLNCDSLPQDSTLWDGCFQSWSFSRQEHKKNKERAREFRVFARQWWILESRLVGDGDESGGSNESKGERSPTWRSAPGQKQLLSKGMVRSVSLSFSSYFLSKPVGRLKCGVSKSTIQRWCSWGRRTRSMYVHSFGWEGMRGKDDRTTQEPGCGMGPEELTQQVWLASSISLLTSLALGWHPETWISGGFPPFKSGSLCLSYLYKQCGLLGFTSGSLGFWYVPSGRCLHNQSPIKTWALHL